MNISPNYINPN